jgi:hypothetical protein
MCIRDRYPSNFNNCVDRTEGLAKAFNSNIRILGKNYRTIGIFGDPNLHQILNSSIYAMSASYECKGINNVAQKYFKGSVACLSSKLKPVRNTSCEIRLFLDNKQVKKIKLLHERATSFSLYIGNSQSFKVEIDTVDCPLYVMKWDYI